MQWQPQYGACVYYTHWCTPNVVITCGQTIQINRGGATKQRRKADHSHSGKSLLFHNIIIRNY